MLNIVAIVRYAPNVAKLILATVVLPVPGVPLNTKWILKDVILSPSTERSFSTAKKSMSFAISSFTEVKPVKLFNSAKASSIVIFFSSS